MSHQFTIGPWQLVPDSQGTYRHIHAAFRKDGRPHLKIAEVTGAAYSPMSREEGEANAALIVEAPTMLSLLEESLEVIRQVPYSELQRHIESCIGRARAGKVTP